MNMLLVIVGCMLLPWVTGVVVWSLGAAPLWLWRKVFPPAVNFDPSAAPPASVPPGWWPLVMLCAVATVPAWIVLAPNGAQIQHLWERVRGYPSTVLSVPLQDDGAAQRAAVLELLAPLRTVGSRRIGVYQAGRHGGWTDTTVVPAYWRVQDKYLEVALARPLSHDLLEHFEQLLQAVQDPEAAQASWDGVAAWHCRLQEVRPLVLWESRSQQLQAMQRRIRACQPSRRDALAAAVQTVAGQVGVLQPEAVARFSPWYGTDWGAAAWTVWTPVPDPEAVQP